MPTRKINANSAFDMHFKSLGDYTGFCRRCFSAWSVCPEGAGFDEVWLAAWTEHARYVKTGLLAPFFFVHDVARILSDETTSIHINGNDAYFRLMGAVGELVAKWEAKGDVFVRDGVARGKRLALRPFFHELFLALNLKNVKSVFVPHLDRSPKEIFENEDHKNWLAPALGTDSGFFSDFFDSNRIAALVNEAPELLERCLGLVRYEERLMEAGRRAARNATATGAMAGLTASDFHVTDAARGAYRKSVWAVAGDLKLLRAYRRESQRTPGKVALMLPGRFSRPLMGEFEKKGLEHRVLGQGPPPGHPVSLATPRPILSRLMAENKVPVYLDQWRDREPAHTGVIFCLHLPSARKAMEGRNLKNGHTSALKLAAFLVAHDIFTALLPFHIQSFDAAFFIYGGHEHYDEKKEASLPLVPALRATVVRGKNLFENRNRRGFNAPFFFDEPGVFPVLFNHAGPWSHNFDARKPLSKDSSGEKSEKASTSESVRSMMRHFEAWIMALRQWNRKFTFFMGGPGFAGALAKAADKGGEPVFKLLPKRSDIFVAEARSPGMEAEGPDLVFGNISSGSGFGTNRAHDADACPYPYQGFRTWAIERVLSAR